MLRKKNQKSHEAILRTCKTDRNMNGPVVFSRPNPLISFEPEEGKDTGRIISLDEHMLLSQDGFIWDLEASSKEVVFSKDFRHAFLYESNYYFRTIIANKPFVSGVHYWEIIADARTEHELKVGVTCQKTFNINSSFSDYEFGYAYYGLGQLRHSSNALGIPFGKGFKKKGILGICLDMN